MRKALANTITFFETLGTSMIFFTNKHVIMAFIVAPILAVGSWYAVDLIVKEKPQPSVEGKSYPLVVKSNCRYTSGQCNLENAEFKSQLIVENKDNIQLLTLSSSHTLQMIKVGFRDSTIHSEDDFIQPVEMNSIGDDGKTWSIKIPVEATENTELKLAMMSNGALYYAETSMVFSEYKTSFNKDFKQN